MKRLFLLLIVVHAGCRQSAPAPTAADAAPIDAAPSYLVVRPAIRCAECHDSMHSEWASSAHASADSSPLYRAMKEHAAPELRCSRCHAPLAGLVDPADLVAREGVTCEVCHSIKEVGLNGQFAMALTDNVQRGTICDAKDHNFHKMGCSPLHGEARFCAACHTLTIGKLTIFTELDDWKRSPYGGNLDCQGCHMPDRMGEVATGSQPREDVSGHSFRGMDDRLFARALTGRLAARSEPSGALHVDVTVKNANAGHSVPGGLPGRQVILRLRAVDAAGATLATSEYIYERVLVDEGGKPAPFYRAVREESDNRLRPREQRVEQFTLDAAGAKWVLLEVVRRPLSPELAMAVGRPGPEEMVLAHAQVALNASAEWQP